MTQYNIEFFDFNLNYLHKDVVSDLDLDDDYLSPSSNSLSIRKTSKLKKRDLLYISEINYLGLITDVSDNNDETTVSYSSILSLFDHNIAFNVTYQGKVSLEYVFRMYIRMYWDSLSPITINMDGANVSSWSFGIEASNEEEGTLAIVNLYSDLIAKALSKYGVVITYSVDFTNKSIDMKVGKAKSLLYPEQYKIYIDADQKNVEIETFTLNEASSDTNRLYVHNASTPWSETATIYLHPDGTYDTSSTNVIEPVIFDVQSVSVSEDTTFEQAYTEAAESTFGGIEWSNLIEINVRSDDKLVKPLSLPFGQDAWIVHEGKAYSSILTQKKITSEYVTLSFGTVRHDLTKKLRSNI